MSRSQRRKAALSDPGPPLSPLPPTERSPQGLLRAALLLLFALYLGFATVHTQLVPTGFTGYQNAPDEAAHAAYVRTVAQGYLPTKQRQIAPGLPSGPSYEWHQPPLDYALTALFAGLGDRGMRTFSILCGCLSLFLIYRLARLLRPDDPLFAVVATGIAALTPGHIAITSTVNNDALLEVCFSGALLTMLSAVANGFTPTRAIWLGIAIGAAILTKVTGLLLLPCAAFAVLLGIRAGEKPAPLLRNLTWTLALIVLLTGWWFARNLRIYGEILPTHAFAQEFAGTAQAADVAAGKIPGLDVEGWGAYYLRVALWTFQSFWAVYGTPASEQIGAQRFLADPVYQLAALLCLTSLAGMTVLHFKRKTEFTQTQRYLLWILFATIGVVFVAFVPFVMRYFQPQGRYLYPAMGPLCLVLSLGWLAVFPVRYRSLAAGLLLLVLALMSVAFLMQIAPK